MAARAILSLALLRRSIFILFLTTSLATTTTSLSFFFNFSDPRSFSNGDDLSFEGDAYAADGSVILSMEQLTGNTTSRSGRVFYKRPVRVRSNTSSEVSGFSTSFAFVINGSQTPIDTGGGLAFYLAPYPSRMPPNSEGGYLGLFNCTTAASGDLILAVELDIHGDLGWDPTMSPHIGVDLNTLHSSKNSYKAVGELVDGALYVLQANYNNVTKDLVAVLLYSSTSGGLVPLAALKKSIDLSTFLPSSESEVTIGISAATGGSNMATHHLLWWSYDTSTNRSMNLSSLISAPDASGTLVDPEVQAPPPAGTDAPSAGSRRWYNNRTVLIGIVVFAVLSTVTAAVVALLCLLSRSTVLKVHYGSYNSLGLSDDLLLPTSERKPPQIHRECITIQLLLKAAFHRIEKIIKYVMQLFMTPNEGLHNHSASISVIQQLRHQNLLLIQRCSRTHDHISLEYESVPNGCLSDHLVNPERLLTWPMRFKIVVGVGSALEYLHGLPRPVRHGNIRTDNVMLDEYFNAKLGGFRAAAVAPCAEQLQATSLSDDVFAFGALLLEIVCGRYLEPIDRFRVYGDVKAVILDYAEAWLDGQLDREEVQRVMLVGLWCSHPDQRQRPSIAEALRYLRSDDALPNLPPPRMPEVFIDNST